MSIATILPPVTVRATTANGLPSGAHARPPGTPSRGPRSPSWPTAGRSSLPRQRPARRGATTSVPDAPPHRPSGATTSGSRRGEKAFEVTGIAPPQGRRRPRPIDHLDRRQARGLPGRAVAHGSRAASPLTESGRRSVRSRRTARRRRRAARRRRVRRASGTRGRRASRARPKSPSKASCSGSMPSSGLRIGSGTWVSRDASRRVLRERSMLRATRPTTVVSHARRLSTSLVSVRLSRIHASWTASSASVTEPSIRKATPRKWDRLVSKRSASQSWSFMGHVPAVERVICR